MSRLTFHHGDNIAVMRAMPEKSVQSIVCDPPYLLTSIAKRFGRDGSAPAKFGKDGAFGRVSSGFMSQKWDSPSVDLPNIDPEFAHYMAGFIDGEGCFHVHKKNVNGCETYDCQFSMALRADDYDILVEMRRQLGGIGTLADRPAKGNANPQVRYCISSKSDCQVLRAVLSVFPLRAKKLRDFNIWCDALDAWCAHEVGSTWDDVAFYRDQLMLVRKFGSIVKPDFVYHYRWARECLRVLKPGGYMLAFSSPRTGHWMAAAFEEAGFAIHPFIGWTYGSGFPKAHDAAKAIAQELGDDTTAAAAEWDGWKYGAQSMKPALEPIYVAQRPFDQKNGALNILTHGVGALNIDGCRVPFASGADEAESKGKNQHADFGSGAMTNQIYGKFDKDRENYNPPGRHPANLLHDGSDAVRQMFPATSSVGHAPKFDGGKGNLFKEAAGTGGLGVREDMEERHFRESDTSAARFFNAFPLEIADADPLFYNSKAGKADRSGSKHPTVKPIALMRWCCRLVTPPGGTVLDPFAGSGSTGAAALAEGFNCTLIEAHDDYAADIRRRFDLPTPGFDIDALIGGTVLDPIADLIG